MDIQQNNVAVLHFNLVNQDGSTIFIRKTKLATFNLINPSAVSVPITDIGFDATLNQCWIRVSKASNATTGQYYGVLNIVDDDWGTYTTSKIKVYSVVSDADEDTKSIVFTATCLATQITNPSGGNSPYYNTTTETWWQYSDTLKAFEDTGVGNLIKYITKNVQHLKDGTGNGSIVTCLDDEISANNTATGLCSTDLGKNNENRGESCVALGENNYIAEGVSNATAIAGAQPSALDVFAVGDKTAGHKNVFTISQFGDISFRPDSSQERTTILQDILDSVIKNVVYDSSNYSLTVTFYSAADNANKIKTYDLSGLKAVLKDDAVKEISVNQATAVMTVDTINGSSQQIQLPTVQSDWNTTDTSADSYILNKPTALSSFTNDSGYDTVTSVNSKLGKYLPLTGNAATATKLATARSITLSGNTNGTATFDGSANITIATSTSYASEAKTLTSFSVGRNGSTNSYGLIASLSLPYNSTYWNEETGSIYVSYNHNDANGKFGLIRLKASGMGGTDGNYGYYSAYQLGNLDSSIVRFSYIAPTSSASGSLNVYAYGNNDQNALIVVTSLTNNVSIYNGGFKTSSIPGVEFYLSDLYMPNVIPNRTKGALTITKNGNSVGTFNGSADTTIALTDTTYSDATTTTHGLMTATDKVKLNGISSDGSNYTGNAATATKATQDGSGHDIESTYATKTELSSYLPLTGNAATATIANSSYYSNYIKSNTWNWSGVGPQGTGSTVRKIASITDMSYLEIDGANSVGTTCSKGVVKISITYMNRIIISNNSTVSTNFGYVIKSTTGGNDGKVDIDLYLQERDGENYYNILVSKLVGSAISFELPAAEAITAPSDYVAIS